MSSAASRPGILFKNVLHLGVSYRGCCLQLSGQHKSFQTAGYGKDDSSCVECAAAIVNILLENRNSNDLNMALNVHSSKLDEDITVDVLRRCHSDWKAAYTFFTWVQKQPAFTHHSRAYNEMLDILGKAKKVTLMRDLFDSIEEEHRSIAVDENTFAVLFRRYASAHQVQEAVDLFHKRKSYGFEVGSAGFQVLLMSLCRYKHVEEAEALLLEKQREFPPDIKTWNIILNGWCILGSPYDAKRVWKEITSKSSKCKPDLFTYSSFINALTKSGKLGSALKLFRSMKEKGMGPDVVVYNCIIDALCFKKRIPEALEIFGEMKSCSVPPNAATYNSLIKHLCRIDRMGKVYELLDEMEGKGCLPNTRTYSYILKKLKGPEDVDDLIKRMARRSCRMDSDTYNLVLNLYVGWKHWEGALAVWDEMEKSGSGPDQRSFTIMIHALCKSNQIDRAWEYYRIMNSRELIPEQQTKKLMEGILLNEQKTDTG